MAGSPLIMAILMKLSLSFWLLLLFPLPILAIAPASPACASSRCSGTTGEKNNESAIGQPYSRGLGQELLNTKLGIPHRPNLDSLTFRTAKRGLKAELIRYHHQSSQPNSSEISLDIKRSLARGRNLKSKKTPKASLKGAAKRKKPYEAQQQPVLGLHTDLATVAPFEYLMKISIGTPPQHLMAVADTGSDLVWLQCTSPPRLEDQQQQPLLDNKHIFDPSNSRTFSKLACNSKPCHLLSIQYNDWISCSGSSRCRYSYFYADNSSSTGDLAVDTLHMKSISLGSKMGGGELLDWASVHNFAFGCGQKQYSTSMLYVNADGVVGLGKGPLSFPSQLGAQFGRRFSYCLVDREKSTVKSSPILFGGIAVPTTPGVQYTPFLDNPVYPTYYYIGLERIEVGEEVLDIPSDVFALNLGEGGGDEGEGGTVIDSGTTFSQLVAPAYTALLQALSTRINYKRVAGYFDFCHDVTGISRNLIVVPRISFHFSEGAKLDLPFKNAFILVQNDPVQGKTTMCLAMNNSTDLGFTIIGNYQQINHLILYDLQEKRLGIVPQQCG